ncbi:MAG: helix-turn-helix transcriptional regulator [Nanoarchaeota archaeon]
MERQIKLVEAIEEGKIVNVPEDYAVREGLPILRRSKSEEIIKDVKGEKSLDVKDLRGVDRREIFGLNYKKPWRKRNDVIDSLFDNFQWTITAKRRQLGLTRKKLAEAIGSNEEDIKMIENGVLPSDDFVLVSKIQDYLGINLRKDGQTFGKSLMQQAVSSRVTSTKDVNKKIEDNQKAKRNEKSEYKKSKENILGDEIEVIE